MQGPRYGGQQKEEKSSLPSYLLSFITFIITFVTYIILHSFHKRRYAAAAAAAAKSLQSCPTLCDPIDGSPPGSAVPGILQARTLEWVAIAFSEKTLS